MDHSPHLHPPPFYSPHQGRGAKRTEWETHLVYLTGALTKWWKAMTSANSCWFKLTTEGTTGKIKKPRVLKRPVCAIYLRGSEEEEEETVGRVASGAATQERDAGT